MALIKCPKCGKKISAESDVCIYCYCNIEEVKKEREEIKRKLEEIRQEEKLRNEDEKIEKKKKHPSRTRTFLRLIFAIFFLCTGLNELVISLILLNQYHKSDSIVYNLSFLTSSFITIALGLYLLLRFIFIKRKYFTGEKTREAYILYEEGLKLRQQQLDAQNPRKRYKCNSCERLVPEGTKKCMYCGNTIDISDYFDINTNLGDKKIETEMTTVNNFAGFPMDLYGYKLLYTLIHSNQFSKDKLLEAYIGRTIGRITFSIIWLIIVSIIYYIGIISTLFFMATIHPMFIGIASSVLVFSFVFIITTCVLLGAYWSEKIIKE